MNSFKFWYKTKHDEEKYNKLCVDYANNATIKKCDKLKGIASSYFVESLDILLTYHYIFKLVVPILFLFLAMIFHHHSTMLLTLIVLTPVSFCATYYVRRKYKLMRNRYYFEIQGLYFCLNEKYKMNKRVTNEELGRHFM
ncbi:MAG: hypothetical protein WC333_01300 [Dehalococcoidia bacterium]